MSTPETTNQQLVGALQIAARELRMHDRDSQYKTLAAACQVIERALQLPRAGELGFYPDTPAPTRLHLRGDGWSEGLPIVSIERDGDTLRVVAAPQIRPPSGLYDPAADRDNDVVQVLSRQPVEEILSRYRDGQLDAVAVAALARKARAGDQLKAALQRDPTTGRKPAEKPLSPSRLVLQGEGWSEVLPVASVTLERNDDDLHVVVGSPRRVATPVPMPLPVRDMVRTREDVRQREAAENHLRAAAASVVAELGAACCCGLKLPGRVARAVRDLAWRLATLKAVRK